MATQNLDHANLDAALGGSLVREDVMEKIFKIDEIKLEFTSMLGRSSSHNRYRSFTTDELGAPITTNKHVDGADINQNDAKIGDRQGNHHQISVKEVKVSTRANAARSIGRAGSLTYQVMMAQKRLRRDVEAQMCTQLPSVEDDGDSTAGQSAGIWAWIKTNTLFGTSGSDGGFNPSTKIVDAPTAGTKFQLSEVMIRNVSQSVYMAGGETFYIMGVPNTIRAISEHLFTASARGATQTNYNQGSEKGDSSRFYGAHTVMVSDFGQILTFVPNRLQPLISGTIGTNGVASLFFLDPSKLSQSFLTGYRTERLAKTGLSEKRMVHVDYTLLVTNEKSQGAIRDIDVELPVVPG